MNKYSLSFLLLAGYCAKWLKERWREYFKFSPLPSNLSWLIGFPDYLEKLTNLQVNVRSASSCSLGIPATLKFFPHISVNPQSCLKCA